MAFTHWTASSVSPEKSAGRAALISVMLMVVDIGFAGGGWEWVGRRLWQWDCGWGVAVVNGVVVDTMGDAVVTRGMIGGKGLVTVMLGCKLEGGNEAMRLGSEGRNTELAKY